MADLRAEHEGIKKNAVVTNGNVEEVVDTVDTGSVYGVTDEGLAKVWDGDRRLSLFSYTIETISFLLLPMMQTK